MSDDPYSPHEVYLAGNLSPISKRRRVLAMFFVLFGVLGVSLGILTIVIYGFSPYNFAVYLCALGIAWIGAGVTCSKGNYKLGVYFAFIALIMFLIGGLIVGSIVGARKNQRRVSAYFSTGR